MDQDEWQRRKREFRDAWMAVADLLFQRPDTIVEMREQTRATASVIVGTQSIDRDGWHGPTHARPVTDHPLRTAMETPKSYRLLCELVPGRAPSETISDVFVALDRLFRAHGGSGFCFRVLETDTRFNDGVTRFYIDAETITPFAEHDLAALRKLHKDVAALLPPER